MVIFAIYINDGKNKETFSGWKKRGTFPDYKDAIVIAKDMGITVEELIEGDSGKQYILDLLSKEIGKLDVPERIADIVDDLLVLDETDLTGIRAAAHALADAKRGEKTGTYGPNG
ncbi:hypothetical protein AGMMS50268_01280 [Spirochaetia bacterium]|nr:hypothetical protein AGMMS50268_01280 [Spirochaetia bacterium]